MEAGFGKKRASAPSAAALALEEEEEEGGGGGGGGGGEDGEEEDPFFAAVAAAAALKRAKKAAAAAAAEEERADFFRAAAGQEDAPLDEAADGHRKASKQILKNRGLVKYRKKEAANPRVAYRLKAEKAAKRRQGQVVTMRDKKGEGDNYGGEATGIRTNISKSRIFK
jgi:U3 small nucleolar RNA-associated protein 3